MSEHVKVDLADGVLRIRLNRPDKKNAIDRSMYRALTEALKRAEGDETVGAVLFCGVPGAFSAGNDIADFVAFASAKDAAMGELVEFLHALADGDTPLVAATDGLAVGIGATLLLHCDLVYATPRSTFRTPFVDLGLVPEAASSRLAPRVMGHQKAFSLLVMGEPFDATAALEAGLVLEVRDDAEDRAWEAARRLAIKPREAVRLSRRLIRTEPAAVKERIGEEARLFAERLRSAEAQAAFAAFMRRG